VTLVSTADSMVDASGGRNRGWRHVQRLQPRRPDTMPRDGLACSRHRR
jgi:hypothetical protein